MTRYRPAVWAGSVDQAVIAYYRNRPVKWPQVHPALSAPGRCATRELRSQGKGER